MGLGCLQTNSSRKAHASGNLRQGLIANCRARLSKMRLNPYTPGCTRIPTAVGKATSIFCALTMPAFLIIRTLDINYGRKTLIGPDRHQQRKQAQLDQALETVRQRVDKKAAAVKAQQDKVAESEAKGHGKRLEQRQSTLGTLEHELKAAKAQHAKLSEQAATLGPAGQRADRDFRAQTIMTIRTLLLENLLRAFMAALLVTLQTKVMVAEIGY